MRTKIDFGIDLGTTNSAIAKMENGKPVVITTGRTDIIPSCVAVRKGGAIFVGDRAKSRYVKDKEKELRDGSKPNSYIEFKREMSNPTIYESTILKRDFTPEELSAEVLKTLKSFVTNETLNSIVITVPAKFNMAQNEATKRAGKLAGFDLIELLHEPIAACIAYGLEAKNKKGTWLVFDFGGGTFDAAIIKKDNDGMMRVIDTEGNDELGGKDLDLAIVDNIILPYLQKNYALDSYFEDSQQKDLLRFAVKKFAEDAKIELSFQKETQLLITFPGDIDLTDDNDKKLCLNIDFTRDDLAKVLSPKLQQTIDLSLKILQRNNLNKDNLDAVILVGGPTMSPVLQNLIKEQISDKIDTSVNPMTIVAKGAALYASTIDAISGPPTEEDIYLDIKYDAATVEEDTLINIKINKEKTKRSIPEIIKVIIERGDKGFVTDKEISASRATLLELLLNKGEANVFNIRLIDGFGNPLPCVPISITITDTHIPLAPLSYFVGIEVWNDKKEKSVFKGLKGLEKNQIVKNAVGIANNLKTIKQLVPGKSEDRLEIRIYQGEEGAEGKDIFLSDHVTSVIITGDEVPKVIPAKSELEVTLKFDQNGSLPTCSVFFPSIDWTHQVQLKDFKKSPVDITKLFKEIEFDENRLEEALEKQDNEALRKCQDKLNEIKEYIENNKGNESGKITALNNLRRNRIDIENNILEDEWPEVSEKLKETFYNAQDLVDKCHNGELDSSNLDMDKIDSHIEEYRSKTDKIIKNKDTEMAKELTKEVFNFIREIVFASEEGLRERSFIKNVNLDFSNINWTNATRARQLINQAISNINSDGSLQQLTNLCIEIDNLIDRTKDGPNIPTYN